MLLYSYPDTVHRVLLRKTQTSTPLIKGSPTTKSPRIGITPAIADCRFRAPLTLRLMAVCKPGSVFHYLCPKARVGIDSHSSRRPVAGPLGATYLWSRVETLRITGQ